jgi:hypothetical protein
MMDEKIYLDSDTESHKRLLWWLYLMHGLSIIFFGGGALFYPTDRQLSEARGYRRQFSALAPQLADPFFLVVSCMGVASVGLLHHHNRHTCSFADIARHLDLDNLSPDTGFSESECQ